MQTAADFRQEKHELDVLLTSGIFNRASNLALMLKYVCARYFEGAADQIKEYNIAVEALGRPADFDQKRDSIVRVEAHRLRKRLREYYDSNGADHAIRIEIPPGQYAPRFISGAITGAITGAISGAISGAAAASPSLVPVPAVRQEEIASESVNEGSGPGRAEVALLQRELGHPNEIARGAAAFKRDYRLHYAAAAALLVVGTAAAMWRHPAPIASKASVTKPMVLTAGNPGEVRILAGHLGEDYTDRLGRVWQSDRYFQGGGVFEAQDHPILGTREPRIYQSRREGWFTYDIPLSPGVYELRLHFAETLYGEGNVAGGAESSRVFNVLINGKEALHEFDVVAEAGPNTADVRAFKDISPAADGKLHLRFEPSSNPPQVSAIEITPGTPGRMRPLRMVSSDRVYVDKQGRSWEPDRYVRGGLQVPRSKPVQDAADPELFRGERFGNLRYVIPVPSGRYGVTFYFAEAWFGQDKPAGGGVGSRVFDILINGIAMRRNFDIFKEAHGPGRAITWSAHGLEPDAQGKLNISLTPLRNYACVNAVEVVDESK
jgi:Malectin domain